MPEGVKQPPSLVNIFKEMQADLGVRPPSHGNLLTWAHQGVLLLNAVLTVREHEANSHKGKGWEQFTDRVISLLNDREDPVVFILWGANAKAKASLITNDRHCILTGAHPRPLSAHNGFWAAGKAMMVTVYGLCLIMGLRMGANEQVIENLGTIGLMSLVITISLHHLAASARSS